MPPHQAAPDPAEGPIAEFAYRLHALRQTAGEPPYRKMAAATHFAHTSLSRAAKGRALPTWEVTEAFVTCCGARDNLPAWRSRWEDAHDREKDRQATIRQGPSAVSTPDAGPVVSESTRPGHNPVAVLARVSVEPRTQQRRVYGTSVRPKGAHRAPGAHRRHKDGHDQRAPRPRPANEYPRALVITATLVLVLLISSVAVAVTLTLVG